MRPASNQGVGKNIGFPDVCNTPVGPATAPLPYPNGEELVILEGAAPGLGRESLLFSVLEFHEMRDEIDALDLSDVEPMNQPYPHVNVLRDDVEQSTLDRDEVMAAAPKSEDGRFWVPPILGGDG